MVIRFVSKPDSSSLFAGATRINTNLFRILIQGGRAEAAKAILAVYEEAALKAGINFEAQPEIVIKSIKIISSSENNFSLKLEFTASGGKTLQATMNMTLAAGLKVSDTIITSPLFEFETARNELLERIDSAQADNDSLLAGLIASLEEMKRLADQRVGEFGAEINALKTRLEALMTEMQKVVDSDRPNTPAIDAIAEKLSEMRFFLDNTLEQEKEIFESFLHYGALASLKSEIAARQMLANDLITYQEKISAATSAEELETLKMEFPVLAPIALEPMAMPIDPREVMSQMIAEGEDLMSAIANKLPEGAVALSQVEQDLAVSVLGLSNEGTLYKTTERTAVNCITTPCPSDIITDKLYSQDGKVIGFKVLQDNHAKFYAADENGNMGELKQTLELVKDPTELNFVKTLLMDRTAEYRGAFWTMWEQMRESLTPIYIDQEEEDARRKRLQQSSIG